MGKGSQEKRGKSYKLGDSCKLVLREGVITRWHADGKSDAIVKAAHEWLLGGGAILRAAGKELLDHCRELPDCPPGAGFSLRVSKIIHTVGVAYKKTFSEEQARKSAETLKNAYKNSLEVARSQGIKFIAFPALFCGINGFPLAKAAQIALETIQEEAHGLSEIDFVLFNQATGRAWSEAAARAGLQPV